jgi:hypothetical protein
MPMRSSQLNRVHYCLDQTGHVPRGDVLAHAPIRAQAHLRIELELLAVYTQNGVTHLCVDMSI